MRAQLTREAVLEYYLRELVPALAASVAVDDHFPDAILNELRNTLTHLARSVEKETAQASLEELEKAKSHLKRATLDLYKDVIAKVLLTLNEEAELMASEGMLPSDLQQRLSEIRDHRIDLSVREAENPSPEVQEQYEQLFIKVREVWLNYKKQYGEDSFIVRHKIRQKKLWRERAVTFFVGIAATLFGAYLLSFF